MAVMTFRAFDLDGPIEVFPGRIGDERGYFSEIFRQDQFSTNVAAVEFVQENQSLSVNKGTMRGLHFQTAPHAQGKLVRCLVGAIFDVAVDIRVGSPSFGRWVSVNLSAEDGNMLWIPAGFAHGFCTLTPDAVVCYKVTAYYNAASDKGLAWDDPDIGISWPECADRSTLSAKDAVQPRLADLPTYFHSEE
jgi:dTDP-4-dehydrorhamnose 3,5-epimerase